VFYGYAAWEKMSPDIRTAYIAGAMDSLTAFTVGEEGKRTARHYQECMKRAGMKNTELADKVRARANAKPIPEYATVQQMLVYYLLELCGKVPG
jgi:hypothetical protein